MARLSPDELKKQLEEQDDLYGDGSDDPSGSAPDPDEATEPTADRLEDVIGNEPDPEEDGLSIAEEVEDDERALAGGGVYTNEELQKEHE